MLKELSVIIFSSFKFAMTFPLAILEFKMGIVMTIVWTNIGGMIGIFVFSYLSDYLIRFWNYYLRPVPARIFRGIEWKERRKKVFTSRNRRIVSIRKKYGLIGIALATPVILSIPVGAFLIVRYFGKHPKFLSYLAAANFIWSVIYVFFYSFLYEAYQNLFPLSQYFSAFSH
jgi:hypothetical protein